MGTRTGRGRVTLRAKMHTEQTKAGKTLVVIDEIPVRRYPQEHPGGGRRGGEEGDLINDLSAINDESGRQHSLPDRVDLKRDADPNVIINQLYQYTPCQITVSMINIALVNRQPRTMGLKEMIQHFIEHRKDVITRRTKFQLKKASSANTCLKERSSPSAISMR